MEGICRLAQRLLEPFGKCTDLVRCFRNGNTAADLGSTTSVHDSVVLDQVSHNTNSIVQGTLGLVNKHLVASSDKDGNRASIGALFNDQHLVLCCAERHFADDTGCSELLFRQVLETRHYPSVRRNSNELHPRELVTATG